MRATSLWRLLYPPILLWATGVCKKGKDKDEDPGETDEAPPPPSTSGIQSPPPSTNTSVPSPAARPPDSKSGTAASPSQTQTSRSFQWTSPDNTTTCDSTTFLWSATGFGNNMTLQVSNMNVPNHTMSTPLPVLHNLTTNVTTNLQVFTWLIVDVPEGWYTVEAIPNSLNSNFSAVSAPFFVKNGTDTSCINEQLLDGSTSSALPQPTAGMKSAVPHKANIPVIVGTLLGALVAFIILSIAFIFPRFWRHALPTASSKGRRVMYYY